MFYGLPSLINGENKIVETLFCIPQNIKRQKLNEHLSKELAALSIMVTWCLHSLFMQVSLRSSSLRLVVSHPLPKTQPHPLLFNWVS